MAVEVPNQQLVALSPQELPLVQRQVYDWCRAKIVALSLELREQRANSREAARMLWRNHWPAAAKRTIKRMVYYAKIQAAVKAGYLIVPNFNVDVLAVRVARRTPKQETRTYEAVPVTPDLAPPGRGRYVDELCKMRDDSYDQKQTDGGKVRKDLFTAVGYDEQIEFPHALVKPAILDATDRAMALNIFDRIGVVKAPRRSDPIVVGQIVDPREKYSVHYTRCVTFFIAWWLDTKDL
jgi:hypothetical protein